MPVGTLKSCPRLLFKDLPINFFPRYLHAFLLTQLNILPSAIMPGRFTSAPLLKGYTPVFWGFIVLFFFKIILY